MAGIAAKENFGTAGSEYRSGERIFLAILLAAAFLVRFWGLSKMHFWDENVYLQNAELICCGKSNYDEIDSRPPLLSILFAIVFRLWHSDYAASSLAALVNALGAVFLYLAGRMFLPRRAAAIAATLFAFSPYLAGLYFDGLHYNGAVGNYTGHSLLADCPAVTLIVLSFYLTLRALARQTAARFAAAGFAMAMSVLMRFGSLSTVGILALLFLSARVRWRAAAAGAAGFVAGISPYLLWSRLRYGGLFDTLQRGWGNLGGVREPPLYFLRNLPIVLSWTAVAGLALWISRWTYSTYLRPDPDAPADRVSRQLQAFLWFWAILVMIFFTTLPHQELRYILPVTPPLFLLAGIGLGTLLDGQSLRLRIAGTALLLAGLALCIVPLRHRFEVPFFDPATSDEMEASRFIDSSLPSAKTLYTTMNYPDFGHYTRLNIVSLPENGPAVYEMLGHMEDGAILVAYKTYEVEELPDPSQSWLDANPQFQKLREWPTLMVYQYRQNPLIPAAPPAPAPNDSRSSPL